MGSGLEVEGGGRAYADYGNVFDVVVGALWLLGLTGGFLGHVCGGSMV